jgi:hypothetical protein
MARSFIRRPGGGVRGPPDGLDEHRLIGDLDGNREQLGDVLGYPDWAASPSSLATASRLAGSARGRTAAA